MKKTMFAAFAAVLLASAAPALAQAPAAQQQTQLAPNQFTFEGDVWTITKGFDGHPVGNTTMMTPGFKQVCPGLRIKLERRSQNAGGVPMSPEAKFRGDQRKHVVCDRTGWQQQVVR